MPAKRYIVRLTEDERTGNDWAYAMKDLVAVLLSRCRAYSRGDGQSQHPNHRNVVQYL